MFIPDQKMYVNMKSEIAGLWCSSLDEPEYPYFVIKLPQNILKSLFLGCRISIVILPCNIEQRLILSYSLIIWDDLEKPMITYFAIRDRNEYISLISCIKKNKIYVHFFDELVMPIISSKCHFTLNNDLKLLESMQFSFENIPLYDDKVFELYCGVVENLIKSGNVFDIVRNDGLVITDMKLEFDEPNKIYIPLVGQFSINDTNEGGRLEDSIYHLIESFYGSSNSAKSPTLDTSNSREFTDILAWDKINICLFESKCLSIIGRENELTSEKRIKNINKHISKALSQLKGAVRKLRNNEKIYSASGQLLEIPYEQDKTFIDCVVLVSEMYPYLDWEALAQEIINASNEAGAFFHIMDLSELYRIICSGKTTTAFSANLYIRWDAVVKNKTAFVRGRIKAKE
jgi:hypothetical protein